MILIYIFGTIGYSIKATKTKRQKKLQKNKKKKLRFRKFNKKNKKYKWDIVNRGILLLYNIKNSIFYYFIKIEAILEFRFGISIPKKIYF